MFKKAATRTLYRLPLAFVGAALLAIGGVAPAGAATNQAVLTVNATVTNNCDVLTQPATLTMTYNPVQNIETLGTSSFTYACTNGASVSVIPTSPNLDGSTWIATGGNGDFLYHLYNDLACTTNQLVNGTSESLSAGTGSSQTYNICAIGELGLTDLTAATYVDTVTFTFDFGP
jgi:spore coat protein U-like protein